MFFKGGEPGHPLGYGDSIYEYNYLLKRVHFLVEDAKRF